MTEPSISMALDKSVRSIDQDGHLHVSMARVSRAAVNGYLGREIPDAEKYGLIPDKLYQLLRHPDELKKAARTWAGKPLQEKHIVQSADGHNHETVVGALGDDVEFDGQFLTAPLTVWDGESIKRIQSGEQKELSSAYRYDYDPTPGVFEGVRYDGVMRNLLANHVSLVETGRAGPECVVGDSALPLITIPEPIPEPTPEVVPVLDPVVIPATPQAHQEFQSMASRHAVFSRQALVASGAIHAFLKPVLATDAKIDLNPILKDVTAKNWKTSKPKIKTALDKALEGKLATDADTSGLLPMLDQIQLLAADEDKEDDKDKAAEDEDDDSDEEKKKKAEAAKAAEDEDDDEDKSAEDADPDDEDEDDKKKPAFLKDKKGAKDKSAKDKAAKDADPEPKVSKSAMDAAIASAVKAATRAAETNTIARLRSIADAEKAVRPYVGELAIACDSAEAVYRIALDAAEVDLDGVPPAAFAAMVKMLPKPGDVAPVVRTRVAMDAATSADMAKRFPGANSLKTR